jgi:hypothetical protein
MLLTGLIVVFFFLIYILTALVNTLPGIYFFLPARQHSFIGTVPKTEEEVMRGKLQELTLREMQVKLDHSVARVTKLQQTVEELTSGMQ